MKYKVGDTVMIRNDLVEGQYGGDSVIDPMLKYKGKTAKVTGINHVGYDLDIDDGEWNWTDEMLIHNMFKDIKLNPFENVTILPYITKEFKSFEDLTYLPIKPKLHKPQIETHKAIDNNCPYIDLDIIGVKELLILEPHVVIIDENTLETFVATCHPEDDFNVYVGIDVALCKRTKKELEDALQKTKNEIETLQNRERTIKRQIEDVEKDLKEY